MVSRDSYFSSACSPNMEHGTWSKVNIRVYSSNARTTPLIIQQCALCLKNGLMVEKEILVSTGTRHALAGTRSYTKYGNYFLDSKIYV